MSLHVLTYNLKRAMQIIGIPAHEGNQRLDSVLAACRFKQSSFRIGAADLPALRAISFHTLGRDEAMGDGSVREGLGTRHSGSITVWKSEEF